MKKVAIMIDGGFLSKTFRHVNRRHLKATDVLSLAYELLENDKEEIFRIYYYDAPPFAKQLKNPVDGSVTDYSRTPLYTAANWFHRDLAEKAFMAVRKGRLAFSGWKLTRKAIDKVRRGKATAIEAKDLEPDFKQKTVDMKIGLDIAWLATKKIVDKIVLVTADTDFIPPMKFARKEGLHITIAVLGNITSEMKQHSDLVTSIDLSKVLGVKKEPEKKEEALAEEPKKKEKEVLS